MEKHAYICLLSYSMVLAGHYAQGMDLYEAGRELQNIFKGDNKAPDIPSDPLHTEYIAKLIRKFSITLDDRQKELIKAQFPAYDSDYDTQRLVREFFLNIKEKDLIQRTHAMLANERVISACKESQDYDEKIEVVILKEYYRPLKVCAADSPYDKITLMRKNQQQLRKTVAITAQEVMLDLTKPAIEAYIEQEKKKEQQRNNKKNKRSSSIIMRPETP